MINRYFFLYVLVKIYTSAIVADSTDNVTKIELCTTASNEQGKCIVISKCQSIYSLLELKPITKETVNYLRKSHCGFNKSEPRVCCSINDNINGTNFWKVQAQNSSKTGILLPSLDICGMFSEDRIIYGSEAQLGSYPWLALLEYQKPNGRGFHCGGVLISNQYVLTAAHCVLDIPTDWNLFSVRLGEHDTTQDLDCVEFADSDSVDCAEPAIDVHIENKIVHKSYKPNDVKKYYDVALLRLTKPITLTEFIVPICLPPANYQEKATMFRIAGWGANQRSAAKGVKQNSFISTETKDDCPSPHSHNLDRIQIRNDQLCIVQNRQHQNICYIDSGGALFATIPQYSRRGNYFALGVSSVIPGNCSSDKPIIFTKIASYVQWIVQNM